jgi:hypothetical protein
VTDVNDNRPVFTKPEFRGTVGENLELGTTVLRVEATDKDQVVIDDVLTDSYLNYN